MQIGMSVFKIQIKQKLDIGARSLLFLLDRIKSKRIAKTTILKHIILAKLQ